MKFKRLCLAGLGILIAIFILAISAHAAQAKSNSSCSNGAVIFPTVLNGTASNSLTCAWLDYREQYRIDGIHYMQIRLRAENLKSNGGRVFEAWLVDKHSSYRQSLGAFSTSNGHSEMTVSIGLVNPRVFDEVWITSEKTNDSNPNPDKIVLRGKLVQNTN